MWGAAYCSAGVLGMVLLRSLPVVGAMARSVPPAIAFLVPSAALAFIGARYRPHGRMPHRHWLSLLGDRLAGRCFYGERRIETRTTTAPSVWW